MASFVRQQWPAPEPMPHRPEKRKNKVELKSAVKKITIAVLIILVVCVAVLSPRVGKGVVTTKQTSEPGVFKTTIPLKNGGISYVASAILYLQVPSEFVSGPQPIIKSSEPQYSTVSEAEYTAVGLTTKQGSQVIAFELGSMAPFVGEQTVTLLLNMGSQVVRETVLDGVVVAKNLLNRESTSRITVAIAFN